MKLSPTMRDAIEYAKRHGNKLIRYPGGFWCAEGTRHPWYGTTTVNALVDRGAAEYTKWQERMSGSRFPIEITLKETTDQADNFCS